MADQLSLSLFNWDMCEATVVAETSKKMQQTETHSP